LTREVNIVFEEALELTAPDIKDIPGPCSTEVHCDQEPDAETGSNRHLRHPEAAKHASQTGKVCKNFECKMIPVRKN